MSQALTGSLPTGGDREKRASGVKYTVISLGLVAVAVAVLFLAPPHDGWAIFFVTMIAAVIMFGIAVGEFVRAGHSQHDAPGAEELKTAELSPPGVAGELPPARETAGMMQPASVAESTTRNLAVPRTARPREDTER